MQWNKEHKYHIVRTVPKSNSTIVERGRTLIPLTHKYMTSYLVELVLYILSTYLYSRCSIRLDCCFVGVHVLLMLFVFIYVVSIQEEKLEDNGRGKSESVNWWTENTMTKRKRTNNYLINITQKTTDRVRRIPLRNVSKFMCSGRNSSCCSKCDTRLQLIWTLRK
jgi:hypothetical protein